MRTSGGGIVTRLAEEYARVEWIQGFEIKQGSHLHIQVIWHNAVWVSTEATADSTLGRQWILQFAQSNSILMASIIKAQIELRARRRIADAVLPRSFAPDATFLVQFGITTLAVRH